jgi:chromosome segregation ATPase
LPEVPSISLPTLDATLPYDELTLTTSNFEFAEAAYSSALLDETKRKLLDDLQNGGYGIDLADEDRLWQRARERELRELDAAVTDVVRQSAARGFVLPPGATVARVDAARQGATEKIASLSRDIASKRADMFVEARRFALTQATQLEQLLTSMHMAVAERALNAAKAQVEMGVTLFNARVARFGAQLDAFKSAAAVYESRVRGALLALEAYKTQVEGARVAVEVQRTHAEVYRTQLQGVEALIGAYTADVQAARALADIERVKLEGFKTTVDAYTAQVAARNAEFSMYEAQLRGEQTKVNLYVSQVQAYSQSVDAAKARTQAEALVATTQIAANEAKLAKYRAELEGFKTEMARVSAKLEGALQAYGTDVSRFSAYAGTVSKHYDLAVSIQEANSRAHSTQVNQSVANAQNQMTAAVEVMKLRTDALGAGAKIYADHAAAALNVINAIAASIDNRTL